MCFRTIVSHTYHAKFSKKLSKRPVAEPQTPLPPENEEIFDDLPSPVGALDLDQTESPSPRRKPPPANKNSSSSRGHKRKREASEPKRVIYLSMQVIASTNTLRKMTCYINIQSEKAERKKAKRPVADSYIAKLGRLLIFLRYFFNYPEFQLLSP